MINLFKRFFCKHQYIWVANIYGDMINACNGKRSQWECVNCGKVVLKDELVEEK